MHTCHSKERHCDLRGGYRICQCPYRYHNMPGPGKRAAGGPGCAPRSQHDRPQGPSKSELLRRLLESIAHEELALAHIINEEASNLSKASECLMGPIMADELIALQRGVSDVLDRLAKKEDLLLKKLRIILALVDDCDTCEDSEYKP